MYVNMKAQRDGKMELGFRASSAPRSFTSGPMRDAIFAELHKREQEHVGADKGIGVLIRIDSATDIRVSGSATCGGRRSTAALARPRCQIAIGTHPPPRTRPPGWS